jgi:DNA polymerase-3 subunit epsilon
VDPECSFDYFNTQLTGIDEDTVSDAPTFPQLWEEIEPLMSSGVLVAHNAPFDMGVLKKCLRDYDIYWKSEVPYCCTVQMGRRILPGISHKLNCLCDYYGIYLDHHQADSDSRAAAEILLRYMETGAEISGYVKNYRL